MWINSSAFAEAIKEMSFHIAVRNLHNLLKRVRNRCMDREVPQKWVSVAVDVRSDVFIFFAFPRLHDDRLINLINYSFFQCLDYSFDLKWATTTH